MVTGFLFLRDDLELARWSSGSRLSLPVCRRGGAIEECRARTGGGTGSPGGRVSLIGSPGSSRDSFLPVAAFLVLAISAVDWERSSRRGEDNDSRRGPWYPLFRGAAPFDKDGVLLEFFFVSSSVLCGGLLGWGLTRFLGRVFPPLPETIPVSLEKEVLIPVVALGSALVVGARPGCLLRHTPIAHAAVCGSWSSPRAVDSTGSAAGFHDLLIHCSHVSAVECPSGRSRLLRDGDSRGWRDAKAKCSSSAGSTETPWTRLEIAA